MDMNNWAMRHRAFCRALFLCLPLLSGCVGGIFKTEKISLGSQPFSPDGKYIIFSLHEKDRVNICRINRDGSGFVRLTSAAEEDIDGSYSPDGGRIVFSSTKDVEPNVSLRSAAYKGIRLANLYMMGSDGSNVRRLTDGLDQHTSPVFSHDGRRIYFRVSRMLMDAYSPGSESFWGDSDIYSIDADWSNLAAVTDDRFRELSPPSMSPDGKQMLVYACTRHQLNRQAKDFYESRTYEDGFWTFPLDRAQERILVAPSLSGYSPGKRSSWSRSKAPFANYDVTAPRFSPDGTSMLFKLRHSSLGGNGILTMDLESKDTRIFAKCPAIMEAVFSPDGKEILYVCDPTGYRDVYELRVINVDGTDAHRIKILGMK